VPQSIEPQIIGYVVQIVALQDEELRARASGVGVLALYEGPPLRADGGRGECEDVRRRVRKIALCVHVSFCPL
jgi:hypothetical protein